MKKVKVIACKFMNNHFHFFHFFHSFIYKQSFLFFSLVFPWHAFCGMLFE